MATRQGGLRRYSSGFRLASEPADPRHPWSGETEPDKPLGGTTAPPRVPAAAPVTDKPSNARFFVTRDGRAAVVGLPDQARTQGHMQPSGAAWGRFGEPPRATLGPPLPGSKPSSKLTGFCAAQIEAGIARPGRPLGYIAPRFGT
jgi:hypothetical protein